MNGRTSNTLDISQITESVYISAWPRREHAEVIKEMDVRLILSMHWFRPSGWLGKPPVDLLWLPTFDSPLLPMPMRVLTRGVEKALAVVERGKNVLIHCRAGRHRSVAMACCVLIATGMTAKHAVELVKQRRNTADPDIWYIRSRINEFEKYWRH